MKPNLLLILLIFASFSTYSQKDSSSSRSTGEFEYEGCGCDVKVNLKIFNGLNDQGNAGSFGGNGVSEEDELIPGAITIANLNDTDGDTVPDYMDNDGVKANINGRDELDLMKLIVEYEGDVPQNCEVKVSLKKEGNIIFWQDFRKENELESLEFDFSELPVTVFIEAIAVSEDVQDIKIEAFVGDNKHDTVKATAIWVDQVVKYVDGEEPNPDLLVNSVLATVIKDRIDKGNNLYGLGYFKNGDDVTSYGGRILIEFNLFPHQAKDLGLYFDITRRLDEESGKIISGSNSFSDDSDDAFELQVEMPNDDRHNTDEDVLTSSPKFYSYDGPSDPLVYPNWVSGSTTDSYTKWIGDFREFVRVSFNPIPHDIIIEEDESELVEGELISGSRCSPEIIWELGRVLVLTSKHLNDPYNAPNQKYEVLSNAITHSVPTRIVGTGTGTINISLLSNVETKGYDVNFSSNGRCKLFSGGVLIHEVVRIGGTWELEHPGRMKLTISDDVSLPYQAGDRILFTTLNDSNLYSKIKLN